MKRAVVQVNNPVVVALTGNEAFLGDSGVSSELTGSSQS
ncbi:unannotated protein [freshwater metagenome]|uniref:Unannotated protein n=1 Tax=freshwater metagenome TaxID=449393 RepID=A0A6J6PMR5_9ZZZZ